MLSDKKRMMMETFLAYTNSLIESLEKEELEHVEEYLARRSEVIQLVEQYDSRIGEEAVAQVNRQLATLLQEISNKDRYFQSLLLTKKNEASAAIQRFRAGKRTRGAYQTRVYRTDGYFIDQTIGR